MSERTKTWVKGMLVVCAGQICTFKRCSIGTQQTRTPGGCGLWDPDIACCSLLPGSSGSSRSWPLSCFLFGSSPSCTHCQWPRSPGEAMTEDRISTLAETYLG